MPTIGPLEIVVLLTIALLVFGPKRLPDLGRSLGGGMRAFKESVTGAEEPKAVETATTPSEPTR